MNSLSSTSLRRKAVAAFAVVLLVGIAVAMSQRADTMKVTAYFTETKGIYVGDDVTTLSVPIGTITAITPEPGRVRVEMKIDKQYALPADVHAAIIGRSLVSVRAIALGPSFGGGAKLQDDATIPLSRTAVPVEWDEVKSELVRLAKALGPNGADSRGSANRLIKSTAGYLKGRGGQINETIDSMAKAFQTLDSNKGDLFATVRNLQIFIEALDRSDAQVRSFNTQLAQVSSLLAGDRKNLTAAVVGMRQAFVSAKEFLAKNTDLTASTLTSLDETISVLAEKRTFLADTLQGAPTAISNFYNILDPRVEAPTGELAVANFGSIAGIVCGALVALDPDGGDVACRNALEPLLQNLDINALPVGANPVSGSHSSGGGGTSTPEESDTLKKR